MERTLYNFQDESSQNIDKYLNPFSDDANGLYNDLTPAEPDYPSEPTRQRYENFSPEIKATSPHSEYDWHTFSHEKERSPHDSEEFLVSPEPGSSDTMHLEYTLIGLFAGIVLLLLLCQVLVYWKTRRGRSSWTVSGRRRFCRRFHRRRNFVCSVTIEKNPGGFRAATGAEPGSLELGRVGLPCRPSLMFNPRPKMIVPEYEYRTGSATSNVSSVRRTRSRPYHRPEMRQKSVSSSSVYVVDARGSHLSKTSPFWSYPPAVIRGDIDPSSLASDSIDSSTTTTTSNSNYCARRVDNRRRRLRKSESCGAACRFKSHLGVTRVQSDVACQTRCHAVIEGGSKEWSSDPGRTTSASSYGPSNELSSKDSSVETPFGAVPFPSEHEETRLVVGPLPEPQTSIKACPSDVMSSSAAERTQKMEEQAEGAEKIDKSYQEKAFGNDDDGCVDGSGKIRSQIGNGTDRDYDKSANKGDNSLTRRTSCSDTCEISKSDNYKDKGVEGCSWQKHLTVPEGGDRNTSSATSSSLTSVSSLPCGSSASCN